MAKNLDATEKQIALITRLAAEKVYASGQLDRVIVHHETIGRATASLLIDLLFAAPRKPVAVEPDRPTTPAEGLTPGIYKVDGVVYQVKPNQAKTRLYAKRIVEINADRLNEDDERVQIEFEYTPGAIFNIKPEHRMGLEEGKALTIRYGRCLCCSRKLKAATSVERGIGPVCIKYFAA